MFTAHDLFLVPFSLFWGGFAMSFGTMALWTKAEMPFPLIGVPFVLVGLFIIFGRFLVDAWLRGKTAYALTEKRVLILRTGPWSDFKALRLDRLPEASLSEMRNGRGTIRFGQKGGLWGGHSNAGFGIWVASLDPTPQFLAIEDAKRVFAAIQERSQ